MSTVNSYGYDDSKYDYLRKSQQGNYYRGEYKIGMNLYSLSRPLRAAINEGKKETLPGWGKTTNRIINTFDAIKWVKEAGMDYVDPTFYFLPGYDDLAMPSEEEKAQIKKRALELKQFCADIGINIVSTGIRNDFCTSDAARLKKDVERAKFYLEMSELMGAVMMRVFAGAIPGDIEAMGFERVASERLARSVGELSDYCTSRGFKCVVGFQNHGDLISTANQALYVMDKLKGRTNAGLINDTGHYRPFGSKTGDNYPWYDDIAACLPVTVAFQLKTKPAGIESAGPSMDLNLFFRKLRMSEYRAPVSFEMLWRETDPDFPEKSANPMEEYKKQTMKFLDEIRAAELATRDLA